MIPIDNIGNRLDLLSQEYLAMLKRYFNFNTPPRKKNKLSKVFHRKKSLEYNMLRHFEGNIDKIILAKPNELLNIENAFRFTLKINDSDAQHKKKLTIFKERMGHYYSDFFSKPYDPSDVEHTIGRWLSSKIDLKVCPYCNHNYTLTVSDRKNKINFRPDFDHFYPKSIYPILALSFYNLIPSCAVCNKLKGSKLIKYSPYLLKKDDIKFELYGVGEDEKPKLLGLGESSNKILVKPVYSAKSTSTECNLGTLGIEQIYGHQVDYVEEIIAKTQRYNQDFFCEMVKSYNGLGKTEAEIDRIIWGAYLDDHTKRPLSKLTNDVLIQLGIKQA